MRRSNVTRQGARRLLIASIYAAAALVYGAWFWWGVELPTRSSWAIDSLLPGHIIRGWVSDGWHMRYPPLHFYLLQPVLWVASAISGHSAGSPETGRLFFLVARLVTLGMALGTLAAVHAISRELRPDGRAVPWALALAAFSAPMAYYAKTTNLDVPYLFWFALALWCWLRWVRTADLRDAMAFAGFAVLSVATKDQAIALFALPAAWSIGRSFRAGWQTASGLPGPARFGATIQRRDLWMPLAFAAMLAVLIFDPITNFEGVRAHVHALFGEASDSYRIFEPDVAGFLALSRLALFQIGYSIGWPSFALGAAGLVALAAWPGGEPRFRLPLLTIVSYALLFIALIGYSYDRFWLPALLVLAIYGAELIARVLERGGGAAILGISIGVVAVAGGMARAVSVDLRMACDGRYAVRAWAENELPRDASIHAIGFREYLPNLHGWSDVTFGAPDSAALRSGRHAYLVTTDAYSPGSFDPEDPLRAEFIGWAPGAARYDLLLSLDGRPAIRVIDPFDPGGLLRLESDGSNTNLSKIAPRVRVFRRADVQPVARVGGEAGPAAHLAVCRLDLQLSEDVRPVYSPHTAPPEPMVRP